MDTYTIVTTPRSTPPSATASSGPDKWDRHDVRARDDILLSAWSGLLVPRQAPAAGGVLVGRGIAVSGPNGRLGSLESVLVDPDTDEVRALVVAAGPGLSGTLTVPASWVKAAGPEEIVMRWCPDAG